MKITVEFQETIDEKINAAFDIGNGDYFMHKNDFADIIAVSEYDIENLQAEGWVFFSLAYYERKVKYKTPTEVTVVRPEPPKKLQLVNSYSSADYYRDEMPDAYTCGGL